MSNSESGTGPNEETLQQFHAMLGEMAQAQGAGEIGGAGKPVIPGDLKICRICGQTWRRKPSDRNTAHCADCQKRLDDGLTCLISVSRFAFVSSERLKDAAGKIIAISEEVMDRVQSQASPEKKNGATE